MINYREEWCFDLVIERFAVILLEHYWLDQQKYKNRYLGQADHPPY